MGRTSELPGYLRRAQEAAKRAPEVDLAGRHLALPVILANRVRPPGLSYDDRLGVANLALVEAARTYPGSPAAKQGIPFVPYATTRIRQALWQASRAAWPVYVPTKWAVRAQHVAQAAGRLAEKLDRPPTDEEVAAAIGWPLERVQLIRRLLAAPEALSLDAPIPGDDDGATFADSLPDPDVDVEAEVTERLDREQERAALAQAIEELPPLMRATLSLRVGIPVPSTRTLTVDEALRVAGNMESATHRAVEKLRKGHARDLRPDAEPAVVRGDGRHSLDLGRAPWADETQARAHRAQDIWRRLASSPHLPPALAGVAQ